MNENNDKEKLKYEGTLLKAPKGLDPETVNILTQPDKGNFIGFEQNGVKETLISNFKF